MSRIYLIAEQGEPKAVLEAWRSEYLAGMRNYHAHGDAIGASTFYAAPFERPAGFVFPRGTALEGWTKPSPKGFSRPKKNNHEAIRQISNIPFPDHPHEMISRELGLPTRMKWDTGNSMLFANGFNTFSFCWTSHPDGELSDVVLIAPNYAGRAASIKDSEVTWLPEGTSPEIPEGFRQVTEAEVDLIFAQAKVARETYQAQNKEIAAMCDKPSPSQLTAAITGALCKFDRNLLIEFDAGPTGMAVSVSFEGDHLKVYPALEKAAILIAPYLVKCEADDWDERTQSSGRIMWRRNDDIYLDMNDDDNDWLYESSIDTDMLQDMEFDAVDIAAIDIA